MTVRKIIFPANKYWNDFKMPTFPVIVNQSLAHCRRVFVVIRDMNVVEADPTGKPFDRNIRPSR